MSTSPELLIVGGSLAGLCCARVLQEKGINFQILEASDGLGGRVCTDEMDGFLFDRGFQVLFTAYPEAKRVLDYSRLVLKPFAPGAISWYAGRMNHFVDPWRTHGVWREALRSTLAHWATNYASRGCEAVCVAPRSKRSLPARIVP